MLNTGSTESLESLFSSEKWRDHFTVLSDTLGFCLSVYTENGKLVFSAESRYPVCRTVLSCAEFRSQCETYCSGTMMSAIKERKPVIFKCHAKIMSFAIPVEYMGENAVVLGQGSFASYEDFRECMKLLDSCGIEEYSFTTPLTFTSEHHTRKASSLVDYSVNQLLHNVQESITLQQKVDSLKEIMGRWYVSAKEEAETYYELMIINLLVLLDIQWITIFSADRPQGVYASLYTRRKNGSAEETFTISENDRIVQELLRGKPYVSYLNTNMADRTDFLKEIMVFYFFPIVISDKLAGIVGIYDSVLKESDITIVAAFCKQAALSIENHRLHQSLYKKFDSFRAVSELTSRIAAIKNHEVLLQTILDKSADLLEAEQGSLMVLDYETDVLLLEAKKDITNSLQENLRIRKGEGIAGKVAELGEPLLVENVESDPRIKQQNRLRFKTRSCVSVPLQIDGRTIGVLNLSDKAGGEVFDEEDLKLIQSFATHAAVVMERNDLFNQSEKLKQLSITDPLTGLLNRRYLQERLEEELSRSGRHGRNLSLLMLDIDGFKDYNDTFGHAIGDKALRIIADTTLNSVRTMDIASRYGGDEFIVILPETNKSLALQIAERLRNDVAETTLPTPNVTDTALRTMTISIGIVCYPEHGMTSEFLLENIDKALYRAKHRGKNRIEVFS